MKSSQKRVQEMQLFYQGTNECFTGKEKIKWTFGLKSSREKKGISNGELNKAYNIKVMEYEQAEKRYEFQGNQSPPILIDIITQHQPSVCKSLRDAEEFSWIDEYLNSGAFQQRFQPEDKEIEREHPISYQSQALSSLQVKVENESFESSMNHNKRVLSVFHNVQKHLIAFLRKISIKRKDFVSQPLGLRAYELWKIFKVSKQYTKKCLYMIFGVGNDYNWKNLSKMASSLPELSALISKHPFEEIQKAQSIIRRIVHSQLSQTSKSAIKHQCKMTKFQQFYDYLQTFLDELSGQGLSMRINKFQKQRMLQKRIPSSERHNQIERK